MIESSLDAPGSPPPRPIKIGTDHTSATPFESRRQVLLSQPLAQLGPRDSHQVVLLRSPLLTPRLGPPRPRRIRHQARHLRAGFTIGQPPQRIDEADPAHDPPLAA